jgi:hypothetical protein
LILLFLFLLVTQAGARDLGQWADAPPAQREWALAQRVPKGNIDAGILCCSMADGVEAMEDYHDEHYWVTFNAMGDRVGPIEVPQSRVLVGSQFGPKVWWWNNNGDVTIRCYAPGPGT